LGPHSWDPGVAPKGVFWNVVVPDGSVDVNLREEKASLLVRNAIVFDGFTLPNALNPFHPMGQVNSVINLLRIEWGGTIRRTTHSDCPDAFRGTFFENSATIKVIATTPPTPATVCPPVQARNGFRFVSDPADTTVNHFSLIGRERNGVFY
jgi:hypothetical protein